MKIKCCICKKSFEQKLVKFVKCPENKVKLWSDACGVKLKKHSKICVFHFKETDFIELHQQHKRARLLPSAIPSWDASKRKWKNLRDSYTKYLRSFRVGTKTSKKYQFWAHAEHMDFLKPYQGPGRSTTNVAPPKDDEDNECDLGYQVLSKATDEDDLKPNASLNNLTLKNIPISAATLTNILPNYAVSGSAAGIKTSSIGGLTIPSSTGNSSISGTIMLPVPSLPTVQLPPSLTAKPILASIPSSSAASLTSSGAASSSLSNSSHSYTSTSASLASLTTTSMPSQVFALPQLAAKGPLTMPSSNSASSVGCLIIEPQLFASADTFKKEFTNSSSVYSSSSTAQITPSGLQIYPNVSTHISATSQTLTSRLNPPLITKIRRVQPSPQSSAINLSFSTTPSPSSSGNSSTLSSHQTNGGYSSLSNSFIPTLAGSTTITATTPSNANNGTLPPPTKKLKSAEVDISAILQANRDLDANTLFFLSLARTVRSMPTKFQSLAKMRCMRIVSDIELELDNITSEVNNDNNFNTKYCTNDTDAPPSAMANNTNEFTPSEHFIYVMSPSRVESMIDLSSDDENPNQNG